MCFTRVTKFWIQTCPPKLVANQCWREQFALLFKHNWKKRWVPTFLNICMNMNVKEDSTGIQTVLITCSKPPSIIPLTYLLNVAIWKNKKHCFSNSLSLKQFVLFSKKNCHIIITSFVKLSFGWLILSVFFIFLNIQESILK